MPYRKLLPALLAAAAVAAPATKKSNSGISWGLCNETQVNTTGAAPAQCGELAVPLDYTNNTSNETLDLQLVRIPATAQQCKGSIQFNFGGPGETARQSLVDLGYALLNLTGGHYDLVAFDPRGTGDPLPFNCAKTDLEAQSLLSMISPIGNSSDTALGANWANTKVVATTCKHNGNHSGPYIGTAYVARDLIEVVDALQEDGLLRYYGESGAELQSTSAELKMNLGFSYGTTLGATVASMFPERIDKIVLDGVQNPHQYYHALADFEEWTQTDYVFSSIFRTCIEAGPTACPLASLNKTATELEQVYWDFLYDLKYHPFPIAGSLVLDYSAVKSYVVQLLYDNKTWRSFTDILLALFTSSSPEDALTELFSGGMSALVDTNLTLVDQLATVSALYGIHCGDRTARADDFETMVDVYQELTDISHVFGDTLIGREMVCAQWQMEVKERYEGNFTATLPNTPMLLIGNTGDAFTPVKSAYNVSAGFEGSVVLETDGFGVSLDAFECNFGYS